MLNSGFVKSCRAIVLAMPVIALLFAAGPAHAQGLSGTIRGTVVDPSGAAIPGATVKIENPVSGYMREAMTDANGAVAFVNLPF